MTIPSRVPRADSIATQERILEASERLFSERGYSGTSLRAIAEEAGVNLAAANYHFGSKENLLQVTFQRCLSPINNERLRRLDAIEARCDTPPVTDIVRAFVEPGLPSDKNPKLSQMLARLFAEPKSISVPLLEHTFRPVASRFLTSLQRALPRVSGEHLLWRFHFLVGAMLQLANFNEPINLLDSGSTQRQCEFNSGVEHLIKFAVAGLCQDTAIEGVER